MPSNKKLLQAAAGNAGESLYVEDVFSTYLYDGNGTTQTITNGIDLAGEGGLVWCKPRTIGNPHYLGDTERGTTKFLESNSTAAEGTSTGDVTAFNADGFSVGSTGRVNQAGQSFASWSFRKAEKFFDVVTYTGTGSTTTVSHNLGSTPGFIIVKRTSLAEDWTCYHVGVPGVANYIQLNKSDAYASNNSVFNNTAPTDSVFTVRSSDRTNTLGETYVAYLFASDAGGFGDDGSESIIKCGSVTSDGSGNASVDVGFEPQWCLWKCVDAAGGNEHGNWRINDTVRGWPVPDASNPFGYPSSLYANTSGAETNNGVDGFIKSATGFGFGQVQANKTYIYIAIRRPMKTPESGTEVFAVDTQTGASGFPAFNSGFPVDFVLRDDVTSTNDWLALSRLTGTNALVPNTTAAETAGSSWYEYDYMDGWGTTTVTNTNFYSWMFKRATGFFDVVAYDGTGVSPMNVPHNLGVTPELIITKARTSGDTYGWWTYPLFVPDAYGNTGKVKLNDDTAYGSTGWTGPMATSTAITVPSSLFSNKSGETYIAYLFATLAGVSKVGSYTGTNTTNNIDCGFSSSARFILIKRSDSSGDWYFWDSARGITVGNDPYLTLNTTAAQLYPGSDVIQPYSSGFTLTNNAGAGINGNGGSYIFLAIA